MDIVYFFSSMTFERGGFRIGMEGLRKDAIELHYGNCSKQIVFGAELRKPWNIPAWEGSETLPFRVIHYQEKIEREKSRRHKRSNSGLNPRGINGVPWVQNIRKQ